MFTLHATNNTRTDSAEPTVAPRTRTGDSTSDSPVREVTRARWDEALRASGLSPPRRQNTSGSAPASSPSDSYASSSSISRPPNSTRQRRPLPSQHQSSPIVFPQEIKSCLLPLPLPVEPDGKRPHLRLELPPIITNYLRPAVLNEEPSPSPSSDETLCWREPLCLQVYDQAGLEKRAAKEVFEVDEDESRRLTMLAFLG